MAKEGIPILDKDYNVLGHYPFDWPNDWRGGKSPPALLRIKAKPIRSGKNKNLEGRARLFVFDGESAAGSYSEAKIEDFAL